jgi:lipoprotein-releasing system permease protein
MSYEFAISLRYLQSKRKQTFISLITWISIGGVTVGVMALIIVLGVMSGFEQDLRNKILGTNSHVVVLEHGTRGMEAHEKILQQVENVPHVLAVTPFIYSQVMLTSETNVSGVVIRGVEAQREGGVTDLERNLQEGSLTLLDGEKPGIILGRELARVLQTSVGQEISVVSPLGRSTPVGVVPHLRKFQVVGIFETGMFEYDYNLAYISLKEAQRFFNMGDRITGLEVKVDDIYRAGAVARAIEARLGYPYWTRDWMEMNRNLFAALKLEKIAMFVILVLIVLVAAFNIISTLIMMVMEKNRDIAILKSMGATRRSIMKIFMMEGLIIGITGTFLGVGGGYVVGRLLEKYQFIKLPSDVYHLDRLPVNMQPLDFLLVSCAAIVISFLATIYPAWSAARLNPVEVLRYE